MQEATIHSTTAYPADNHTQGTFEKAASASKGQPTSNRKDAISPANIFQMIKSHPIEYAPTEELVHHPVAEISTLEPTKIHPSPTLYYTADNEGRDHTEYYHTPSCPLLPGHDRTTQNIDT
eukprot:scaffold90120_cov81-Attheya_sp.AAC.3